MKLNILKSRRVNNRAWTRSAQGDVHFCRIDKLPEKLERINPEHNHLIVAHSETGHHHVIELDPLDDKPTEMYRLPDSIYDCFLVVHKPSVLKHLRDYDTHEPLEFQPGIYHVKHQREYDMATETIRHAQD